VRQLVDTALYEATSESWQNAVGHVIREELRMWELDGLSDVVVDRLIISCSDDETSSDDDELLLSNPDADIEGIAPLSDSS
jgi:hypothetical protein